MSTAPFPGSSATIQHCPIEAASYLSMEAQDQLKQGHALERLRHAVTYLIDSRMLLVDETSTKAEAEALGILMRLSRTVFSDCVGMTLVSQHMGRVGGCATAGPQTFATC
jgi:hypothetical protein